MQVLASLANPLFYEEQVIKATNDDELKALVNKYLRRVTVKKLGHSRYKLTYIAIQISLKTTNYQILKSCIGGFIWRNAVGILARKNYICSNELPDLFFCQPFDGAFGCLLRQPGTVCSGAGRRALGPDGVRAPARHEHSPALPRAPRPER